MKTGQREVKFKLLECQNSSIVYENYSFKTLKRLIVMILMPDSLFTFRKKSNFTLQKAMIFGQT
jgi:hypothetical protein